MVEKNITFEVISDYKKIKEIMTFCANSFYDQSINSVEKIAELAKKFSNSAVFIVAKYDSDVAGFTAFYCNDVNTKIAYLSMIIVVESYKGKGVGSLLLNDCINLCIEHRMSKLRLEVNANNDTAIKFYIKNKFIHIGNKGESYYYEKSI